MKDLHGRVVVITGAGSGMGRAYAIEAARRGAALALNDFHPETLSETVGLLPRGTRVHSESFDVGDRDAVYAFADSVARELGGADIVINNAGIEGRTEPVWALEDRDIERVMAINFWGVVHGTRAFLPQLLDGDFGAVVNVSSLFGLIGAPSVSPYCAAKFAVRGFSESLGIELLGTPVSVYTVHPGGVATNITANAAFARKFLRTDPAEVAVEVLDAIGTRRTRIVLGHNAATSWIASRLLPQWLMARLVWRDTKGTFPLDNYPAGAHLRRSAAEPERARSGARA